MEDHLSKAYQQIDRTLQNLRSMLTEHLAELEKALKDASGDVHSKVAERKSQARKLQLDEKLTQLFDELKYYPSRSKREDWAISRLCEIDNPEEERIDKETHVQFLLTGRVYRFTYLDKGGSTGFDGRYFHHTKLSLKDESGKLLIEIKIALEHDYVTVLKPFASAPLSLARGWRTSWNATRSSRRTNKYATLSRSMNLGRSISLRTSLVWNECV